MNMSDRKIITLLFVVLVIAATLCWADTPKKPTAAITFPVQVDRVIDGDTLAVSLVIPVHVRLLDCWSPEIDTPEGKLAAENMVQLAQGKTGLLRVPYTPGKGLGQILTFGRVLGHVEVEGVDLSAAQVATGFATENK